MPCTLAPSTDTTTGGSAEGAATDEDDAPDHDLARGPGPRDAGGPGLAVGHVTDAEPGLGPDLGTVLPGPLNDPGPGRDLDLEVDPSRDLDPALTRTPVPSLAPSPDQSPSLGLSPSLKAVQSRDLNPSPSQDQDRDQNQDRSQINRNSTCPRKIGRRTDKGSLSAQVLSMSRSKQRSL